MARSEAYPLSSAPTSSRVGWRDARELSFEAELLAHGSRIRHNLTLTQEIISGIANNASPGHRSTTL